MQTIVLMVVLLYAGPNGSIMAQHYEEPAETLAECWDKAHALAEADFNGAEELIGVGAGCAVHGRATHAGNEIK